ncbi:MAG: flagellar biosynthetic protein FliR, partial [Candidatus Rokubacteria bacterium]|nr:flagellar biosynthetic protein FliR [Candidatus Rokubacteria bacterium]
MTFTWDPALVSAFALALVRASAWLFVSPPFNTRIVPIPVKAGIAAALALAAAPHVADAELSL